MLQLLYVTSATSSVSKVDGSAHHAPLVESFHTNTMHKYAALSQLESMGLLTPRNCLRRKKQRTYRVGAFQPRVRSLLSLRGLKRG